MTTPSRELHGTARLTVLNGQVEEFVRLVEQCVEVVRTKDPGTIEYAVYLSPDRQSAFVHERYRDSEAGLAHMQNIASLSEAMARVCTMVGEVCGEPDSELREALEAAGVTIYAPVARLES